LQIKFGAFCQFLGFDTLPNCFAAWLPGTFLGTAGSYLGCLSFGFSALRLELKKLAGKFGVCKFPASGISQEW
jgi:hypothetical protein